ncbi:decaprenyl-phosphate phosphoribosyltransferase [Bacteroidota bacterium]
MISEYIRLIRVHHWIKNLFVFVPLIFAKLLFEVEYVVQVLLAFLAFSIVSSMVYVVNDLFDIESDKLHPKKKFRPLASGKISKDKANVVVGILAVLFILAMQMFNWQFNVVLISYVVLNILYTLMLKNIVIIDIISIGAGFMLRVIGGAYVIDVYVSNWLILTALFISLFLAVMKRRAEIAIVMNENDTRKVLQDYSLGFIDQIATISSGAVIICYALYSVSDRAIEAFNTDKLIFTVIFVIFGIFRYMYLVHKKSHGESSIEIMISDLPMLLNILFYFITITLIIYFI